MPQTRYAQGRSFEYKVQKDLEARRFHTLRMAHSAGDMKVDLVAVREGLGFHSSENGKPSICSCHAEHLWIQCKRTGSISIEEWNKIYYWSGIADTVPILAQNGKNGRGVTYIEITEKRSPRRGYSLPLYSFQDPSTMPV